MIGLVACCGQKRAGTWPARELYVSPLFRLSVAYVERRCREWHILSAKHGLVHPNRILEPYDLTLAEMPVKERAAWTLRVHGELATLRRRGETFLVLGGRHYVAAVIGNVVDPLKGLQIGERLSLLSADARSWS